MSQPLKCPACQTLPPVSGSAFCEIHQTASVTRVAQKACRHCDEPLVRGRDRGCEILGVAGYCRPCVRVFASIFGVQVAPPLHTFRPGVSAGTARQVGRTPA